MKEIERIKDIKLFVIIILEKQRIQITCHGHFNYFLLFFKAFLLKRLHFCFSFCFGTIGLAIDGTNSKDGDITIGFFRCSL